MLFNKNHKRKTTNPKTLKDKRYRASETSLQRVMDQALAKRRMGVRSKEVYTKAKISGPTLYAHCRNVDDALKSYESQIMEAFLLRLPENRPRNEVTFIILLNFVRQYKSYFAATLQNHNAWLLTQLIDTLRPLLVSDNINDKCFDIYTGSITTLIFCWYKHEGFSAEKIPLYTKKLVQLRVIDIGI